MKDLNNISVSGRLTKDVEMKYLTDGTAVSSFSIAVQSWKKDKTDFFNISLFGKTAELAGEYCKKGKRINLSGRLETNNYEKDGKTVYGFQIVADYFQMTDKKEE